MNLSTVTYGSELDSALINPHRFGGSRFRSRPGNAQMDYRVYIVGRTGRFIGVREIDAPDDNAALKKAKQYVDGRDVEIWQRERRIGRISADRTNDQSPIVRLALRRLSQRKQRES